jgi:hypothetical protein
MLKYFGIVWLQCNLLILLFFNIGTIDMTLLGATLRIMFLILRVYNECIQIN